MQNSLSTSPATVVDFMEAHQAALGLSNHDPLQMSAAEQILIKHLRALFGNAPGEPIMFEDSGVTALVAV